MKRDIVRAVKVVVFSLFAGARSSSVPATNNAQESRGYRTRDLTQRRNRFARFRLIGAITLASACSLASACPSQPQTLSSNFPGADRDAHGCIASAGYAWCEYSQQCERPWMLAKQTGFAASRENFAQYCRTGALN